MQKIHGFNGKILHVYLDTSTHYVERMNYEWYRVYAGSGLMGAYFLLRDSKAGIDPLSSDNLLIFASSIIAGSDAPGLACFSVICKSPLSGGIAETICEGAFAQSLKRSGYDAIIIHGKAASPTSILIENGEPKFIDSANQWGKTTFEATNEFRQTCNVSGENVAVIGPAGEKLIRYASIVSNYGNQAARMGVGAVMGSKMLKAMIIKGGELPALADQQEIQKITKNFKRKMYDNQLCMWQFLPPGFSASSDLSDYETAYIGEKNYTSNLQVANSNFRREKYLEYFIGEKPCPGCSNNCIKYIGVKNSINQATAIHQQVTGSIGPNLGNTNLEIVLKVNEYCNLYGLDPVSLGFTLSFAIECFENNVISYDDTMGMHLSFSNDDIIIPLIELIVKRDGIGDILAEGSYRASKKFGKESQQYAIHVKGIEMVSFEPRTQTNLALGYAIAPIGPRYNICEHDWDFDVISGWEHTLDHAQTLGILKRINMEYLGIEKVRNFKSLFTIWSACDALNICTFASPPTRQYSLEDISHLIKSITGWETSSYEFMRWGERRIHLMKIYNLREGIGSESDTLPERFFNEPIKIGRQKNCVLSFESFKKNIQFFYQMYGWDEWGIPLPATLFDNHLEWTIDILDELHGTSM